MYTKVILCENHNVADLYRSRDTRVIVINLQDVSVKTADTLIEKYGLSDSQRVLDALGNSTASPREVTHAVRAVYDAIVDTSGVSFNLEALTLIAVSAQNIYENPVFAKAIEHWLTENQQIKTLYYGKVNVSTLVTP